MEVARVNHWKVEVMDASTSIVLGLVGQSQPVAESPCLVTVEEG